MASARFLVLSNGSVYPGEGFGAPALTVDQLIRGKKVYVNTGEVVFNTAMSGYHEVLTDPSYTGQIVMMTYPHMGNYGDSDTWNESGPEDRSDKRPVKVAGFVVRSVYKGPVPAGRITLDSYLKNNGIPGISELDTRRLTLELRTSGAKMGLIVEAKNEACDLSADELTQIKDYLDAYPSMEGSNLIMDVGASCLMEKADALYPDSQHPALTIKPEDQEGIRSGLKIALIDCGAKANIIRELKAFGAEVLLFPSTVKAKEILESKVDGILISNGPGDPGVLEDQIQMTKELLGKIVVTGICLGHQIISLAVGAKTYKMKFGHHGLNHPVRDERSKKVFVTSQNHGFAVDENTLPSSVEVWFRNANDQTVEGIISDSLGVYTAQFHPESAPGPNDSLWIFGAFLRGISKQGAR